MWQTNIRKSRLDSISLPTGIPEPSQADTGEVDSRPVSANVSPTTTRNATRVRLSDKNMYKPIEPDVFEDSSSEMEHTLSGDTRDLPPTTTVQAEIHMPGPPLHDPPGYDCLAGNAAGAINISTADIEVDNPPDPPGVPATDSVDFGHD